MFPTILASDFDGVICDGLIEYLSSTQQAYKKIWSPQELTIDEEVSNNFYRLRPVIETGWEMPVLLRALLLNYEPKKILNNWHLIRDEITNREQLDKQKCAQVLDGVRDNWIKNDLDSWLKLHRFYPGVLERLTQIINSDIQLYIVTTKEGRFVKQLLNQQGIDFPATQIIGKEAQRPKYETLRIIRDNSHQSDSNIWFVEDRIQALKQVQQQPDLKGVKLFLADWGYNTETERNEAKDSEGIQLISGAQFAGDFNGWLP